MPRISLDMDADLLRRLEEQAEMTGTGRADLIETAVTSLVRHFEAIDVECGRPCTCGLLNARGERRPEARRAGRTGHMAHCLFRPADASVR